MNRVRPGEFLAECYSQGVNLHPQPQYTLRVDEEGLLPETPTNLLQCISGVSTQIKEDPYTPLISKRLDIPERFREDTSAHALANILNASLEPLDSPDNIFFEWHERAFVPYCSTAEGRFLRTINALGSLLIDGIEPEYGGQIIIEGGRPVMIRKSVGEPSALTLESIVVNGIPYPRGSIAAIGLESRDTIHYGVRNSFELVPAEQVRAIRVMRLSAFALSVAERAEDFLAEEYVERDEIERFETLTMDEIVETANRATNTLSSLQRAA